ncbi:MAG: glycosyltransferase [Casimicrobium sp.]
MIEPSENPRKRISLVIPMFNEGDAIAVLFARLDVVLPPLATYDFEIVCVNDGSTDQTLITLMRESATRSNLVVVDLSRNFGKEAALSAGLFIAAGDAVIPMDADLQDPPEVIKDLLAKWEEGFEVVLARRGDRSSDSVAKRFTAQSFYRIHNAVADVEIPADVGDFRLMDRVVVEALNALPEGRRFMKGLFAWVGFKTTTIDYRRDVRAAGTSKFNAWKLWNFALEGIFSFSISPLKIWTYLGFFVALAAVGWGGWIAVRTIVWGVDIPGYASVLVGVLLLGGLQLIGIGMIGEYLGRAFLEAKRRPAYLIRKVLRDGAGIGERVPDPNAVTYESRISSELSTFEHNEVVHDLPAIFHYWSNTYLRPKIETFGFSHPDDFFIKQLVNRMAPDNGFSRFVSIGAGNCDTEIRVATALRDLGQSQFVIECLELNPAMLDRGRELAAAAGLSAHVVPVQADFNNWSPSGNYHAVMANQSLHHVMNLEGLFDAIAMAIKHTNGVLITSDMIGRNGHQRWPEALAIVEEFWRDLEPQYHYNHQLKRQENTFVNWDCATEGFEGIRAQDILPLLVDRFHFDLFVPFANVISPFIDRGFGPNFDVNSDGDRAFIDRVHFRDEAELSAGRIKPTQMFAVLSLDHSGRSEHPEGLTPKGCIRVRDENLANV